MKLHEMIKKMPDDDWLELREELRENYRVFLGRCPKKYIKGIALDYEVVSIPDVKYKNDYVIYSFIIKK